MEIAQKYNLYVIEDAAQGMTSSYKGKALGTIGHLGTFSFHETKNYTSGGEGGLLIINDETFIHQAEIIREKGTNRSQFFRGMTDKYSWVNLGSSYLMNDLSAAFLWGQIEKVNEIKQHRLSLWYNYWDGLKPLQDEKLLELPHIPSTCEMNGHMFYIKVKDLKERTALLKYLGEHNILAVFHYVPLHSAPAGIQFSSFFGEDKYTTQESERLVRLPLYFNLTTKDQEKVIEKVLNFFNSNY